MNERRPRSAILLPVYPWNPYQRLLAAALTKRGVEARTVETWPRRAPILGAWLANGRPEVVHLHWLHDFLGGSRGVSRRRDVWWLDWQLRLLRWMGVRLVWTVHNLKGHETEDDERRGDLRAREAAAHLAVIERCHAIVLHCEFARAALIERYRPSESATTRMHILPHGSYVSSYDVDADRAVARASLGLEDAGTVFAFIGAIRGYKGVASLLGAFSASPELGRDARLLVCGKPLPKSLGNDLRNLAEADPRIILRLDRIPEEELSPIIRAADAVVLPFRDILTSGSAILALSHGRPVIAPALGCLPGTLPPDATILYDAEEPGALDAALAAASRADLAAMGLRARHYADTLDWDDIAMQTEGLYYGQVRLPAS
jgi:glycosyltransferase involved in cell wall biosynthesis